MGTEGSEANSSDELLQRLSALEAQVAELKAQQQESEQEQDKLSIVVYSGELDRMLAAMNIATGAASMGIEVHLFFTFWATSAMRKGPMQGERPFVEKVFGWMLPAGHRQLKLSTMHWAGLGTSVLKTRMKAKNVADLDELFAMASEADVKVHICEMSMDLLGMKLEDLVDYPNMDQCGVATFLGDAMESKVTLFV
ncbi:MAG: NADH dehydrogenase FAD-containing subunit [Proteobacteria bacterium]|jgi:peroxiredoxin family protein|nr:NADH dehydrogenase FAD-containing subunit [Pseudomonadota bacterium]